MTVAQETDAVLTERILALKRERRAVILAHNYQVAEVKAVADVLGDSYALAVSAQRAAADWIVFCGVRFMAETAKLLNPSKRVVLPESAAGCDLADSITPEALRELKGRHPEARTVMYINCNIEIKAQADAICTSANALKVIEAMDSDEVIFGPDRNLAWQVARRTRKRVIAWEGYCPIHERITLPILEEATAAHPSARVVVHPECPPEVQEEADAVLSTSQMLDYAAREEAEEFIVATEIGLIEELRKKFPGKRFFAAYNHKSCDESCACPYMKFTLLKSVARALESGQEEIAVPEPLAAPALRAVERMLQIGK